MSQYKYAEIADTVYFWFAANETTGTAGDGASPLFDVRLAGAAADAAPTASGTPTLLTHADYGAGLHEIAIDTTGYAAGEYAVFCTLTISTVNPGGFVGSFKLRTAGTPALKVDTIAIGGTVQSATDLKDFADAGYDPATHKVQGVVLTDTCTTNTDLVSAASIVTALKASTGYSVGTFTFAEVIQIIASAVAGKVIDKSGVAGTIQHLDVEDATTVIFENVPSNTTSPYRDPTIV